MESIVESPALLIRNAICVARSDQVLLQIVNSSFGTELVNNADIRNTVA